jgi:hypothetical protein
MGEILLYFYAHMFLWKDFLIGREPHLFVKRPHKKERKDKRVPLCKVALQKY